MLNGITGVESKVLATIVAQPQLESKASEAPQRSESLDFRPPFVSPAVRLDPLAKQVVLEFRDSESGEVVKQIPSEKQMQAYLVKPEASDAPSRSSSSVEVDVSFEAASTQTSTPKVENNTQSSQSLGPSGTLGDGDTSSFSV